MKSFSLLLSPNSVQRESGCLVQLTICVTPVQLHLISTHAVSLKLYFGLALDLSVPSPLPCNRNNCLKKDGNLVLVSKPWKITKECVNAFPIPCCGVPVVACVKTKRKF